MNRFKLHGNRYNDVLKISPGQPQEVKQMEEHTVDIDTVMGFVHSITQHGNNVARFAAADDMGRVHDELTEIMTETESAREYLTEQDPNSRLVAIFTVPEEERP